MSCKSAPFLRYKYEFHKCRDQMRKLSIDDTYITDNYNDRSGWSRKIFTKIIPQKINKAILILFCAIFQ